MATTVQPHETEPATKKLKSEITNPIGNVSSNFPTDDRFINLLLHTKVDAVRPPENKIFVAQRTDNIIEVWKGLVQHNFLSVPVLQKTKSKYYGFVETYDILKYVVDFFGATEELKNAEDWTKLASAHVEFMKKSVNDVMKYPLTRNNPFFPIHSGYSLLNAIEAMAREKGLHRIPVIDSNRNLITVITQSQIVKLLNSNLNLLGAKKNKPVVMMDRYLEDVFTVHEDQTAMEAFRMMVEKGVSGLAVINSEGKLSGTISHRDLKAVSVDTRMFWRLFQTTKNFLLKIRKENNETGGDRPRSVVTVKSSDTLETVIKGLAEHNVHRIFITDDNKKPVGVISLKDVLYEIIN